MTTATILNKRYAYYNVDSFDNVTSKCLFHYSVHLILQLPTSSFGILKLKKDNASFKNSLFVKQNYRKIILTENNRLTHVPNLQKFARRSEKHVNF